MGLRVGPKRDSWLRGVHFLATQIHQWLWGNCGVARGLVLWGSGVKLGKVGQGSGRDQFQETTHELLKFVQQG